MNKGPRTNRAARQAPTGTTPKSSPHAEFDEVIGLIDAARCRAVAAVNTTLIDLYWSIGATISRKIADDEWGKGTVEALAEHIQRPPAWKDGLLRQQPLADAAVFRDLPGRAKTRTTGARIVLDP
jgi:DUF1016 N-terminal domain